MSFVSRVPDIPGGLNPLRIQCRNSCDIPDVNPPGLRIVPMVCPYDLEYRIGLLIPGMYEILVIDISHGAYHERLHFEADLTIPVGCMYCEE